MAFSTDVRLPRDRAPVFPDRCVACNGDRPLGKVRFGVGRYSWHFHAFWEVFRRHSVEVPVCVACRPGFRLARAVRMLMLLAILVAAAWGAYKLNQVFAWHLGHHLLIFLGLLLAIPALVMSALRPLAFDMTASEKEVVYEFRDPGYAAEFAKLNGAAVEP